jgi:hypothetical protein
MFEAKAHPQDRYLYVRLAGVLTMREAREGTALVVAEAKKLKPGFSIIADISEARPNSPEVADVIKTGQQAVFEMGAARSIRIVGIAGAASLQLSRTQRESQSTYVVLQAPTLNEAIRMVKDITQLDPSLPSP